MREIDLTRGLRVPALGQGTWRMGEARSRRDAEIVALREGVELGMTLIDTAEIYGDGATETLVGDALAGIRNKAFLVSKAYPQNGGGARLERACEASLRRLKTDRLDLYLLHWRGSIPLDETVRGMEGLVAAGKIRSWGVSNFDTDDIEELVAAGGAACVTNQILYNVTRRGPEFDLLPNLATRGMSAMAYSPLEQGNLPGTGALATVAGRHGVNTYQVALAWVLRRPGIIAIPKAATLDHVHQNRAAAELVLTDEDLSTIDAGFPPPGRKSSLQML